MTTKELYVKGARVWTQHPDKIWEGAVLLEDYKSDQTELKVAIEGSNNVKTLTIRLDTDLPPLKNPDILVGENNLTSLSFLHEPAVLHNLQVRFQRHSIYTYCGIVLVAFNPYYELPIYGHDTIWAYRGQAIGDLEPHIFAVAEEAYTKLERESRDQSIIVSGESGAGKTVSAKYTMRYFATVGGSLTETQVEKKVLASSPIMEAIGNAKTTRNDNSSRFGKFLELQFGKTYNIIGASMRTYLLEKSRVVFQASEERNYHIFYQMCASSDRLPDLHLGHQDEFNYLNQGCNPTIPGVDDSAFFDDTVAALNTLGFDSQQQNEMLKIFAAILHLGNITISGTDSPTRTRDNDSEGSSISPNDKHLLLMSELLGIDVEPMRKWLCHRKIVSVNEVFLKKMNLEEANGARDALAKHIYAELFNWIVAVINNALQSQNKKVQNFIGVLDIYGFETFDYNSFEQFCINYANEKLQQQFNQHVFKLEQEEYVKEEIEWTFIDFDDNQPCIDLIEAKLGILDLLDEECRMPRGSDASWGEKIYSKCGPSKHFGKARFGTSAFLIQHFADTVQYETPGFLEKNRDTVIEEQIDVLRHAQNTLLKKLFIEEEKKLAVPNARVRVSAQKPTPAPTKQNKKTVGSQFRDSLNLLMSTLNATMPHYIRCIKPNDTKVAFEYNPKRAVQQLRACGVLETIRISSAGFPSQRTYADFFNRYRGLCPLKEIRRDDLKETCRRILALYIQDSDKFKFGKTKVLFRAGQVAFLEKLRSDKQMKACIIIQKMVRGLIARTTYGKIIKAIRGLQKYGRGYMGRKKAQGIRRERAAIKIQAQVKGWSRRRWYLQVKRTILGLQTFGRGKLARKRYESMRDNAAAIVIQRFSRGYLIRMECKKKLRNIIIVQNCVRKYFAKKLLKQLKTEARSVEHVKSLNKGLEMKIITMQQRMDELTKETQHLKAAQNATIDLKSKMEGYKSMETEIKKLNCSLKEKQKELTELQQLLTQERDEKMDLLQEKEKNTQETDHKVLELVKDNERLKKELTTANEKLNSNLRGAEEKLKNRLEQEKDLLLLDQDQDRGAYQKLLNDYHDLEHQCEMLKQQLAQFVPGHSRSLSNASSGSGQAAPTELPQDDSNIDFGYGSVRSTASSSAIHSRVETIDWNQQRSDSPPDREIQSAKPNVSNNLPAPIDVGLVLKLQQKLKDVEKENSRLIRMVEDLERNGSDDALKTQDSFRLQELEIENDQVKKDLDTLRKTVCESDSTTIHQTLMGQFEALQDELERRKEECIQLHSVLADNTKKMKSLGSNYGRDVDIVNEDGELVLAFEAQKRISRQLEDELKAQEQETITQRNDFLAEIDRLHEEVTRQQKLLSVNLSSSPQTQTEAYMQHEITRLTSENLDLQDKYDKAAEECRKLKTQYQILVKRLRNAGQAESSVSRNDETVNMTQPTERPMAMVRKKERDYQGMFEFKTQDMTMIIRQLVIELKPRIAVTLLPGLPAYIMFMCVRHTDYINDDDKVRTLLTGYLNAVKKVVKRREDIESSVLWLNNTLRLLHNMKQYSGDKPFQVKNSPRQNEQCLKNFDLSEYRVVLGNVSVWIYNNIVTSLKDRIQPLTIPALLEHEEITGLEIHNKSGRQRSSSVGTEIESTQKKLDTLLEELNSAHNIMQYHGVEHEIIVQLFKQLFYFMCANALNNLLLRNDLCHWSKGMQIRYNLSHLEQWVKDQKLPITLNEALQPIIQAAQLLQARKSDNDVNTVCDMCQNLTPNQIIKILNLYTPADEYEGRVPVSFIQKVEAKLSERGDTNNDQILMDLKYTYPVRFQFNPSDIRLEDIEVPQVLQLSALNKI